MKKNLRLSAGILSVILAVFLLIGSASCKKCRTCTAYDWEGYIEYTNEYCATGPGANNDLEDWEDGFRSTWWDYDVTCTDD